MAMIIIKLTPSYIIFIPNIEFILWFKDAIHTLEQMANIIEDGG